MNEPRVTPAPAARLELEFAPDLESALRATKQAQAFLVAQGLPADEAHNWRLVLAEATNNLVLHGVEPANKPARLDVFCGPGEVEAQLVDFGPGFDWPVRIELPEPESESSRGLFLIVSLTDGAEYHRGVGENRLVLKRRRACPRPGQG